MHCVPPPPTAGTRYGLIGGVTEQTRRTGVPEVDDTLAISSDDCVGLHGQNGFSDCIRNIHDSTSLDQIHLRIVSLRPRRCISIWLLALSLTVFCEYRHAASRRGFRRPTSSKVLQRKKPRIRSGAQD